MFELNAFLYGLVTILSLMFTTWLASFKLRDVSIVDSMWGIGFIAAAVTYALSVSEPGPRTALVLALVIIWGLRLSSYITWRNWGQPEDKRYQEMRENRDGFSVKSLYLVFGLQGVLLWLISLPLLAAIASQSPLGWLDYLGVALWLVGFVFESGGDYQLARFKANPANKDEVLNSGFWRYTRHPNYFGEFCQWWGIYLIALAGGGWWSAVGPALLTVLLFKVSGVALTEKNIAERRPGYRRYIERTNAFFPGPKSGSAEQH